MDTNTWAILAELLERAADEFSNHGCNDFDLPNTPENNALIVSVEKWDNEKAFVGLSISKDGKTIYASDSQLMSYFAHLARELAGIDNLQFLCQTCNLRKHTKTIDYRPDGGEFARQLKEQQ